MASAERQHLPTFQFAVIDWQATFAAVMPKAGTDREAQWWRSWDDHPTSAAKVMQTGTQLGSLLLNSHALNSSGVMTGPETSAFRIASIRSWISTRAASSA